MPTRAIFDTNVWISGLLWRGKPYQCLVLAYAGLVQVVYCQQMLDELATKLCNKFGFSKMRLQAVLHDLQRIGERVEISGDFHVVGDDPSDDIFIGCALVSGTRWIVSGDRHLLAVGRYQEISVPTAADFIAQMERGQLS